MPKSQTPNKSPFKMNGFTLAEILVVISIFIILIVLILSIYILSQKAYYTGDAKAEIDQNGRIAFDRLSREIRQAREIVTDLPETNENPPSEIMFEDGHNVEQINYVRYYLTGTDLRREISYYSFSEAPTVQVKWNAEDEQGDPPEKHITEDNLIAEYVEILEFYKPNAVNIYAELEKNNHYLNITTKIFGRNLR